MEPVSSSVGNVFAIFQSLRQTAQQDLNQTAQNQRVEAEDDQAVNRLDETENRTEIQQADGESNRPSPDPARGQNLDITV